MRALCVVLLLAGCREDPAPPRAAPPPPPAAQPRSEPPPPPPPPAEPPKPDNDEIGRELMEKETIGGLSIGLPEEKVAETAGRPGKKTPPEMSEALGVYMKSWIYPAAGLEVWMSAHEKKGPYRVLTLRIEKPSTMKTSRGIGIGSPASEVAKAYPRNASESGDEQFVAGTLYGGLLFELADGQVDSIFLGASAE